MGETINPTPSHEPVGQGHVTYVEKESFENPLSAIRICEIPSNMQLMADYGTSTDGLPDYMGYGPRGLAISDSGWLLKKFTYDANRQCTTIQIAYDAWDNHATTAVYA